MKIQNKLFLFLFGFSLILVTVLVLLMQWSIGKGMIEYVVSKEIATLKPIVSKLAQVYEVDGNWHSMTDNHRKFRQLISQQLDGSEFESVQRKRPPENRLLSKTDKLPPHLQENRPPPHGKEKGNRPPDLKRRENRPPPPPKIESHYALLDIDRTLIVGNFMDTLEYVKTPVTVNNRVVGFFAISKRNELTQGYEVDFIEQQQHYLWLISLWVMGLVALVTFPLARHVVEPIKLITRGMHKLTQGDYKQSIHLKRKDELSQLSLDYNDLALTLAENESARKRWLANISHELRTPVAILRGELDAMLDKVRPLSLSNIESANDEVKHLQRLIDDLNLLTSADIGGMHYRKQHQDLVLLMQSEADKYHAYLADADITLTLELNAQEANIYVDINRLVQLFENIINNCIKYSAATELKISVTLDKLKDQQVIITFADNGVGVAEEHLSHLFEHLYRVEDSRNRKTGGSGLGLSICRHIVIAHQGKITAEQSSQGGLAIIIKLPIA